jgi:hypothetical protein
MIYLKNYANCDRGAKELINQDETAAATIWRVAFALTKRLTHRPKQLVGTLGDVSALGINDKSCIALGGRLESGVAAGQQLNLTGLVQ